MSDPEPRISSPALLQEKGSRDRQGWGEPSPLMPNPCIQPHHVSRQTASSTATTAWMWRCALLILWQGRDMGGPGAGARLWPAGQSLEQGWDSGTNLLLAVLELNQRYLDPWRRCP